MNGYTVHFDNCRYAFSGEKSILEGKDLGICSNVVSVLTPEESATKLAGLQACPYTCTSFCADVVIGGETPRTKAWKWLPNAMLRKGETETFTLETLTAALPGQRAVVEKITLRNTSGRDALLPVQIMYRGKARKEASWTFDIPLGENCVREDFFADGQILLGKGETASFCITSSLDMKLFSRAYIWEGNIPVEAGGTAEFYLSAHLGETQAVLAEAKAACGRYEDLLEASFAYLQKEIRRLETNLPELKSSSPELDRIYYRSLVTYLLCRWENPELCAVPFYSTGSINGACMCSYLWNYCGGLMLHPVYDPEGNKAQLRSYLRNDLTRSYALNPVTGGPVGPWYQINQEKIILMVYHHVRATGDTAFLLEQVGDKTVLEWMRYHAYVCDDLSRPAGLYDYGVGGNDHLEIAWRGNGPYNGVMPDLNARRYMNYLRVYELTVLAGEPDPRLTQRAEQLKEELKTLWNGDAGWYDFIGADGKRGTRYTVQMFKFLHSGVIGKTEREGLVSHLNDREFLSAFGLHSMSKTDSQYDQDDIDNGGGGICGHFTMQIVSQLYAEGYDALATDILRRVYWWGERVPYWGDSFAANMMRNREDTPLQGDIASVSCAQMVLFYLFGVTPDFDGSITVRPARVCPAASMRLENIRLRGKCFTVAVEGDSFTVTIDGKTLTAPVGEVIRI